MSDTRRALRRIATGAILVGTVALAMGFGAATADAQAGPVRGVGDGQPQSGHHHHGGRGVHKISDGQPQAPAS